jgi:hypothetical protein
MPYRKLATEAREKDVFSQMWLCHRSQVSGFYSFSKYLWKLLKTWQQVVQVKWERPIPARGLSEENLAGKLQGTAVGVSQIHNSSSVLLVLHQIRSKKKTHAFNGGKLLTEGTSYRQFYCVSRQVRVEKTSIRFETVGEWLVAPRSTVSGSERLHCGC